MSLSTDPTMKILFLHGYTQSGPLFNAKSKSLQKTLQKSLPGTSISYSFPTAPFRLQPADLPGEQPASGNDEMGDFYGWWRRDPATLSPIGLPETFKYLRELLKKEGPFTGVVGFSQGAALAAMLTSALEPTAAASRDLFPEAKELKGLHPPVKFCVCYSGFRVQDMDAFYEPKISTPVLHFIGSLDAVVVEERSVALVESCAGGEERVVRHPGGHFLPGGKQFVNVLVGFVKQCLEEEKANRNGAEEKEEKVEDIDPFAWKI